VVGEFPGVGVGTGHYQVDWSAALGGDLLHIEEGMQLVSRCTQSTDFAAYVEDTDVSDFLGKKGKLMYGRLYADK
jgi:hypothetical protein